MQLFTCICKHGHRTDFGSSKEPFKEQTERFLISTYHFLKKKQPEVSKNVVSILQVLTALRLSIP